MVAYREKNLQGSVKDCYEKADNPENLYFSIVSEQSKDDLHADLSFIPKNQITYRKYNLSEYRGILWSRAKTTEVSTNYDYVLYTCGHNIFTESWDTKVMSEYKKAQSKSSKAILTVTGLSYSITDEGEVDLKVNKKRPYNSYRPKLNKSYTPGYGFPKHIPIKNKKDILESVYVQFSWIFCPKKYVEEVPIDPSINYHVEEIYTSIVSWAAGWKFYATPEVLYYHDTDKKYPDEEISRMTTHRPWSDINKDAFWEQSDESIIKLNALLSGNLHVSKEEMDAYCDFSGLNKKWCVENKNYHKINKKRHGEAFRYSAPYTID
jgi:hypothetical protein